MAVEYPSFVALQEKLPPKAKPILERLDTFNMPPVARQVVLSDIGELIQYQENGRAAYGFLLYMEKQLSGLYAT